MKESDRFEEERDQKQSTLRAPQGVQCDRPKKKGGPLPLREGADVERRRKAHINLGGGRKGSIGTRKKKKGMKFDWIRRDRVGNQGGKRGGGGVPVEGFFQGENARKKKKNRDGRYLPSKPFPPNTFQKLLFWPENFGPMKFLSLFQKKIPLPGRTKVGKGFWGLRKNPGYWRGECRS